MLLSRGKQGNEVAAVQFALNSASPLATALRCDGIFGPKTEKRVREHQAGRSLAPDGIVGPLTFSSLFESVVMQGSIRMKRLEPPTGLVGNGRSIGPPNLGPPMSPELAAWAHAQQAFARWWAQPVPKPDLPTPGLLTVPMPGPFGPIVLARQTHYAPPPPVRTTQIQFTHEPQEGGELTLHLDRETTFQRRKASETVARFSIEWLMTKGRFTELALETALTKGQKSDEWGVEVEFSVTSGGPLALELERGPLTLKLAGHLAAAVSTEWAALARKASATAFLGPKADAEIVVIRGRSPSSGLKIFLTVMGGLKAGYGPLTLPDGREVQQWLTPAFVGVTSGGIGLVFD